MICFLEAKLTNGNSEVMMALKSGNAIRFEEDKVRPTGRGAIGVFGVELDGQDDEVIGMLSLQKDTSQTVLVISENGFGKRTPVSEYRLPIEVVKA